MSAPTWPKKLLSKKRIDLVAFNGGGGERRTSYEPMIRTLGVRLRDWRKKRGKPGYENIVPLQNLFAPFLHNCLFFSWRHRAHTSSSKDPCNDGLSKVSDRPTAQSSLTIWWEEHREILIVFFCFSMNVYYTVIILFSLSISFII